MIAVCDFTIDSTLQWSIMKSFWKFIFSIDHVYLNEEHRVYLEDQFEKQVELTGFFFIILMIFMIFLTSRFKIPYFIFASPKQFWRFSLPPLLCCFMSLLCVGWFKQQEDTRIIFSISG